MKAVLRRAPPFMIALLLLALSAPGVVARPSHTSTPKTSHAGLIACDLKVAVRGGQQVDTGVTAGLGQEVEFYGYGYQPNTDVDVLFGRHPVDGVSFILTETSDEVGEFFFAVYFGPGEDDEWTVRAPAVAPAPGCSGSDSVEVSVQIGHPFGDIANHLFEAEIAWLYQRGITTGCGPTVFCPDAVVTREQMASFLARALALPATTSDFFTDDETSIHEDDINRLAASGITTGCTPTSFCPMLPVTREQMASFLVRGLGLAATASDFFTDDETSIHEDDINRLAASGITAGCTSTTFCPTMPVTRGQMAAFLERALF